MFFDLKPSAKGGGIEVLVYILKLLSETEEAEHISQDIGSTSFHPFETLSKYRELAKERVKDSC
jgi:hypothetical protein